ncbi:IS110 family transposase [Acrocarpospora macrocephala]|uniref:IS110 family transposase n=1 Tax=Acrocarpospora macrocephala TaxID=150177 RepID=A0A5M3WET4_9ACTN|nr:transposase [Acrocarpospora macrocephala]GES06612.1 IS110 family transposase [Acrocarpospora macrocephala]
MPSQDRRRASSLSALAELAAPNVKACKAELVTALTGAFGDVHATEIAILLELIDTLQAKVVDLDERITVMVAALPGAAPVCTTCGLVGGWHAPGCIHLTLPVLGLAQRLDEITGVGLVCAHVIIAELGTDVIAQFPTPAHAAAWAKLTPITNQSGTITRPGKAGKGNRWLRAALGAAAMFCAKTKDSFLGERYRRIRRRGGKSKAMVAVARSILEIAYLLIADPAIRFRDMGADYYDTLSPERQTRNKIPDLERLNPGMKVALVPIDHAAV